LLPLLLSPLVSSEANSVVPRLGEFWLLLPLLNFLVTGHSSFYFLFSFRKKRGSYSFSSLVPKRKNRKPRRNKKGKNNHSFFVQA
jgi:hypothetical protein